jgi:hypothetical protein
MLDYDLRSRYDSVDSSALRFGGLDSVGVFEVLFFLIVFVSPFGWRLVGRWVLCSFGLLNPVLVSWADFGKLFFLEHAFWHRCLRLGA